ncbi:MAG: hypothetical protein CME63_18105 [Halobacteriovoraceae bacterium]|nr:hypothetical protein [Halobacteriovoraceae bacterium]|tara:strand:- start:2249 stop:2953 length:705 start_codon:yes stop_codon:yes gene_type:complete
MANTPKDGDKADAHQIEITSKAYKERLKLLKKAQEFSQSDEIPKAVEYYGQYLNALALYYKVDESKLSPKLFDPEKDIAELFLISHAYWDLAKAYDRSPNLHLESIRCLDQFVNFTIGYKYQYANARTIKSFIRKRLAHNPAAFKQAYERIQVESKGCFISTDLFGSQHPITHELRQWKFSIQNTKLGFFFIESYYNTLCPFYFKLSKFSLFRPILRTLSIYSLKLFIRIKRSF